MHRLLRQLDAIPGRNALQVYTGSGNADNQSSEPLNDPFHLLSVNSLSVRTTQVTGCEI